LFVPRELGCGEVPHIALAKCLIWGLSSIFLRILNLLNEFLRYFEAQNFDTRCKFCSGLCHPAAGETKITSTIITTMTSIAADVAEAKNTHDVVCIEHSIKGGL
jgi:hypothetical protein